MKKKTADRVKTSFATLFKKGDLIVLVLLVAAVVLSVVAVTGSDDGNFALVYIDGDLKYSLPLDKNASLEILDGSMTVVVEDGKVYVSHSDCPEQLCVHSAPLTAAGGMTACLPNKVIVKIDSGEVDAIS